MAPFNDPFLDQLLGDWLITRTIRNTTVRNTLKVDWVLQHQFLRLAMKDADPGGDYEALVLIGSDGGPGRYVAHWCDSHGGNFSAMGHGQRVGETILFEFHYPSGPFFNTFTWSAVKQEWAFRGESLNPRGERVLFAEDRIERAPAVTPGTDPTKPPADVGPKPPRHELQPGRRVRIVQKEDQATGRTTEGYVKDILTRSSTHPHGIKVRLESGLVGRVKEILD
jgi:uncharacterized repeat protein (TIGR03833 family)